MRMFKVVACATVAIAAASMLTALPAHSTPAPSIDAASLSHTAMTISLNDVAPHPLAIVTATIPASATIGKVHIAWSKSGALIDGAGITTCGKGVTCTRSGDQVQFAIKLGGRSDQEAASAFPGSYVPSITVEVDGTVVTSNLTTPVLVAKRLTRASIGAIVSSYDGRTYVSASLSHMTDCFPFNHIWNCQGGNLNYWHDYPKQKVALYYDPPGSAPQRLLTTLTTDNRGHARAVYRPFASGGHWFIRYEGNSTHLRDSSLRERAGYVVPADL